MRYRIYVIETGGPEDYGNLTWEEVNGARRNELIQLLIKNKTELLIDEAGDLVDYEDASCCLSLLGEYSYNTRQERDAFKAAFSVALQDDNVDWKHKSRWLQEVLSDNE